MRWPLLLLLAAGISTAKVNVVLDTPLGEIEVELDDQRAPATTANFLKYVDGGFYNGGVFHRTVKPTISPTTPYASR